MNREQQPSGRVKRSIDALHRLSEYHPESSKRLMLALRANIAPFVSEIRREGEENLDKLPVGQPIIWAMTHCTNDVEMQSGVLVVGEKYHTVIANNSSHHSMEDPLPFFSLHLAGKENFYPISHRRPDKKGKYGQHFFNVSDYTHLVTALEQGKAVAIAAHNPTYTGELPNKPGVGIVALSSLAESRLGKSALIVPVAMSFTTSSDIALGGQHLKGVKDYFQGRRANVTVRIGEPVTLPTVDIETYNALRSRAALEGETAVITDLQTQLMAHGAVVMNHLADLMPPQNRGIWGTQR